MRFFKSCPIYAAIAILVAFSCGAATAQTVINVRDFGAKGDGVTDDTNAVNNAIAAGVKAGPGTRVFVPAGKYLILKPTGGVHVHINNANGLIIGGVGAASEIMGDDPNASIIDISNSKNTTIRNLTIEQDKYYFTQGTCISMDHTAHTINLLLDPGYPDVDDPHIVWKAHWTINVVDPKNPGRYMNNPSFTIAPTAVNKIGDRLWQLTFPDFRGYAWQNHDIDITGKKVLIWDDRRACHGISGSHDKDITIDSVNYYGKGVNAGLFFYDCDGTMTFHKYVIGCPPGSQGVLSCSGGGQLIDIRGSLVYDQCDFEHFDDDGADIFTGMSRIVAQNDPRTLLIQGGDNYRPGDSVALINWNIMGEYAHAKLVNVQHVDSGTLVTLDQDVTVNRAGRGPLHGSLTDNLKDGIDRITDFNLACSSVTFKDCKFQCNRARPLNLKCQNTTVENCTFFNCMMAPIEAGPEMWWGEAPSIHNLTIRGCRFYSCDNEDIDVGVFDGSDSMDNSNILIENNRFDQFSKKGAIRIRNAKGVIVKDNWFGQPEQPLKPGKKVINVSDAEDVTFKGNTGNTGL